MQTYKDQADQSVAVRDGEAAGDRKRGSRFSHTRAVLIALLSAPFRLHHYRDVHSRMLRDALGERDCGSRRDRCA